MNPIDNFDGRIRGADAVEFAEKWLTEDKQKRDQGDAKK